MTWLLLLWASRNERRFASGHPELRKKLASQDGGERKRAALRLGNIYRDDRAALGDHGEEYWKTLLILAKTDDTAWKQLDSAAQRQPRNEGPGRPTTEDVRLDDFWVAELRYAARESLGHGKYVGFEHLERNVKGVRVQPPPGFNGSWTTYYVNGAEEIDETYGPNRCETKELYDDGNTREKRVYDREKQQPIGLLVHYYRDGQIAYEQPYNPSGQMHGMNRGFYPSGKPEYERAYVNGKGEGKWKSFSSTGALDLCAVYHDGNEVSRGCE